MTRGQVPARPVVTRFAPSPTGRLHLGHAYSAIRAHDFARAGGGAFLLRIEDIDGTRSRPEHVDAILADLRWLGLDWDGEVVFQSRRLDRYAAALDALKARGLVYPCFCTRADVAREIAESAFAPHAGPDGPIYPGTCRALAPDVREARIKAKPHAWRLDVEAAVARVVADNHGVRPPLTWHDEFAGTVAADPAAHGDVVLARKDAPASYHLAVALDDAAQGVTDVVRGVDLFPATDIHRLLQALFGLPTPEYHHHGLLTGPGGERLAKRHGAPTLESLRLAGEDGRALADRLRGGELPVGFVRTSD
ncbi:tRNA glutamyl-Q(34) synthetase GluQRS [Stakelama saccharophila]|uniref:tRNA glutamyl-Q(34) synthetase GluQRS n=1 Tax=Stakelama saccharophila TaxID=3075605 RepID=A0ABZ0BAN3_9SPHN|nr:tRNA glutamyl-Q(34) synthetase GluQRS [Stakelama sp. W311]WNO54342.1 tRNA glutamyl-Q(34) synthetase GluQRS [Stakelama sp. W311]